MLPILEWKYFGKCFQYWNENTLGNASNTEIKILWNVLQILKSKYFGKCFQYWNENTLENASNTEMKILWKRDIWRGEYAPTSMLLHRYKAFHLNTLHRTSLYFRMSERTHISKRTCYSFHVITVKNKIWYWISQTM